MREHEVPTHLQAEDRVLLGLTFPQVVACAAVLGLAYGAWQYAPFPSGARLPLAIVTGALGLALTLVRPGGRPLPVVALDLLRFAVGPRRYRGRLGDLLTGARPTTPAAGQPKSRVSKRPRPRGFRPRGTLFRCLSILLAGAVLFSSLAPQAVLAAGPQAAGQRLFIEVLEVQEGQASLVVHAATALRVAVTAQAEDGQQVFHDSSVLYQGEQRQYILPLVGRRPAVAIAWQDAVGGAGIQVLESDSLPYPLPRLEGQDCTVAVTQLSWEPGSLAGLLEAACAQRASEVVELVLLQDPDDPSKVVRQRVALDALVQDASGTVRLTASGPGGDGSTTVSLAGGSTTPFSLSLPTTGGLATVSLAVDIATTRVAELPGKVELVHHEARVEQRRIPVVAWFEGFTARVTGVLRAVWDPFYETVSASLSAWFEPVTRTLSATLRATWEGFSQTVGAWVSTTVGRWVSTWVGAEVWAQVGTWLSTTVGTWVSSTVGTWVSTTVGAWVSAWVGGFYTTVTTWVGAVLSWLNVSVWVPSQQASGYATGTASGYASGTASGYASGTASGYASGWASGYASAEASGYAEGIATGYASTQVWVPGRTEERSVSETVTVPGQWREQTVSEDVWVPGRTSEKTVSRDVWVPGREVEQEVTVEVAIPAYTSAEVVAREPLVRQHHETLSGTFGLYADAPYRALDMAQEDGGQGGDIPSQLEQYVRLLDEEAAERGQGTRERGRNPYRDALESIARSPYFQFHPDEAARLRSLLFLRWVDSLSVPLEARLLMEDQAGGVASDREHRPDEIGGQGVPARELLRALTGKEPW